MSQHIDPEVKQSFIVDNLTTNDAGKALSAKQGKALKDAVDVIDSKVTVVTGTTLTNLNNVTATGLYSYDKLSSAMTNAPDTGTYFSGTLRVTYYQSGKIMQEFVHETGRVFTRHLWNGTWGSWNELALNSKIANAENNLLFGERFTVTADISTTGDKFIDVTYPTTPTGFTRIGGFAVSTTYRAYVKGIGGDRLYYYVTSALASTQFYVYPVYIKA